MKRTPKQNQTLSDRIALAGGVFVIIGLVAEIGYAYYYRKGSDHFEIWPFHLCLKFLADPT